MRTADLTGKVTIVVNVASHCGFTGGVVIGWFDVLLCTGSCEPALSDGLWVEAHARQHNCNTPSPSSLSVLQTPTTAACTGCTSGTRRMASRSSPSHATRCAVCAALCMLRCACVPVDGPQARAFAWCLLVHPQSAYVAIDETQCCKASTHRCLSPSAHSLAPTLILLLQFGEQEPGAHAEIEQFVASHYGAQFPLMSKVRCQSLLLFCCLAHLRCVCLCVLPPHESTGSQAVLTT